MKKPILKDHSNKIGKIIGYVVIDEAADIPYKLLSKCVIEPAFTKKDGKIEIASFGLVPNLFYKKEKKGLTEWSKRFLKEAKEKKKKIRIG